MSKPSSSASPIGWPPLTEIAEDYLQESRTGRNILHHLVPLLRQSIYSRLAGYDDTNDAVRLSQDPAMRVIVGWQGSERKGASTSEMGRFETEFLTQEDNLKGLINVNYSCRPTTITFASSPPVGSCQLRSADGLGLL